MIASVQDLSFSYGSLNALQGVTLEIPEGATGLLGPNGAGKTTLIHLLLGLLAPTGGRMQLFGVDRAQDIRAVATRSQVGYMPESEALIPAMTGVEMVAFLARLSGLPARDAMARAHEALYYVGLGEARYRLVSEYSTGMRQRIKLAQALVHGPRFVILDEPTNGLDPLGRDEMLRLIVDLWQNKGLSVLLSSHLLPDVETTCRSVIVLDKGKVVATRSLTPGVKDTQITERKLAVRVKTGTDTLADALRGQGVTVQLGRDQTLVIELPEQADASLVFAEARRLGLQIRHLVPVRASLEDFFVEALAAGE